MTEQKLIKSEGEVKFVGDMYAGAYTCGLSMLQSATMGRFSVKEETAEHTVLETPEGIVLTISRQPGKKPGVTIVQTSIENHGKEPVVLEMLTSFLVRGIRADKVHRMRSFWSAEARHTVDTVGELNLEVSWGKYGCRVEKFGNVGSMPVRGYFPFMALEDSENQHVTAVSLYSPASWQMEIICQRDDTLTIAGGIADRDFGQWTKTLQPGERLTVPKAVLAEGATLLEACDLLVNEQTPDRSSVDNQMGITFNEYCATWGNPTYENLKKVCDTIAGKGIQYLVMDSGWFLAEGEMWWDFTGNWTVNQDRFPGGLRPISDYIRAHGMIPGIWFEPEVVAPHCPIYNMPEHLVKKDGVPLTVGYRRFLDMEDPWVRAHLREKVIGILKEGNFGYIKIDYNDTMGMGCDGPDGLGENLRQKVLATQDFFMELKREIPELVIENCSSGGHRLEPSMMELCSMASFSDAHEPVSIPLIAASQQLLVRPDQNQIWAVLRKSDTDARIYYSLCATLFGRMGMSGDIYELSTHQWELIEEGMAFYKQASDIIAKGKTIRLEADHSSFNAPKGSQLVVRQWEDNYLIVCHRFGDFAENASSTKKSLPFEQENVVYLGEEKFLVQSAYGSLQEAFSAKAWIAKK